MVDFTSFKVPIFPGINDAPVSPTASKGGNGSDLVARFNGLTDTVEQVLSNIGNNKPVIGNEQFLYVNIANGNDTEGDGSEGDFATPLFWGGAFASLHFFKICELF